MQVIAAELNGSFNVNYSVILRTRQKFSENFCFHNILSIKTLCSLGEVLRSMWIENPGFCAVSLIFCVSSIGRKLVAMLRVYLNQMSSLSMTS